MKTTRLFSIIALILGLAFISNVAFAGETKTSKVKTSAYSWMCKNKIESEIKDMPGVTECNLDLEEKIAEIKYDSTKVSLEKLTSKIKELGYTAEIVEDSKANDKVLEGKESGKTEGVNKN